MLKIVLGALFSILLLTGTSFAHSGGTDASGCHQDHKNGGYHCHKRK